MGVVRALKSAATIPGVRIWVEPQLRRQGGRYGEPTGAFETEARTLWSNANGAPRTHKRRKRYASPYGTVTPAGAGPVIAAPAISTICGTAAAGGGPRRAVLLLCHRCHQDAHARILRIADTGANDLEALRFERQEWW